MASTIIIPIVMWLTGNLVKQNQLLWMGVAAVVLTLDMGLWIRWCPFRGYWARVYECCMCGAVLLAARKGLGCSRRLGRNNHCDGAAPTGLGLHTGTDMDVVSDATSS